MSEPIKRNIGIDLVKRHIVLPDFTDNKLKDIAELRNMAVSTVISVLVNEGITGLKYRKYNNLSKFYHECWKRIDKEDEVA